jgi:hypothetical protein
MEGSGHEWLPFQHLETHRSRAPETSSYASSTFQK